MGQPLTIHNQCNRNIWVEWWTVGQVFRVAGYSINANSCGTHKIEAFPYEIVVTDQERRYVLSFQGGGFPNVWIYDGNNLISITGNPEPCTKQAFSTEHGQLSLPLSNPTVQKVIAYVKALDHKPAESSS
jgi:hypothetical protein